MYLEQRFNKNLMWDAKTEGKSQGLFVVTCLFEHILAFSAAFYCLEPLNPLVTKLQKQNQDIYLAYSINDLVMPDLKCYRENMDEFQPSVS